MKPHSDRPQANLGESWGNVEYEDVKDNYSSGTASVPDSEYDSRNEDVPTPPPAQKVKVSPRSSKSQPSFSSHTLRTSRASIRPTRELPLSNSQFNSPEPSFIMPSMPSPAKGAWIQTSPLRNSQLSKRPPRRSTTPMDSPPRPSPRISKHSHYMQPGEQRPFSTYQKEEDPWLYPQLLFENFIQPIFHYLVSIIGLTLQLLKPVISYVLLSFVLIALFTKGANFFTSIYGVLSPICFIPGSSYLGLPFCSPHLPQQTGQVEFEELMKVQSVFEDVLHSSIDGANLPLDMKRSEASIRDLKHVVRFSTLPSRNELGVEFQGFIDTARQASSDLTRFNSRIGRAVDQILNINRWTIQILDGISNKEASTGTVSRFLSAINPFSSFLSAPHTVHEVLFEQYLRHTKAIEEQISSLIMEAQALLGVLENLDVRLDVIAGIATRDGVIAKDNRDELFEYLWTKLGGNRASVAKLNEQLRLLREVTTYRRTAWKHVSATVLKLQEIASGLEDLRERVAEPEIIGIREEVPLWFHLENIRMGVERLEGVRGETRRMEGENYRKILDKAMLEEQKLLAENQVNIRTVDAKAR